MTGPTNAVASATLSLLFVSSAAHAQDLDRSAVVAPISFAAQVVEQPAPALSTPRHTGIKATLRAIPRDFRHLGSRENLMWVGLGAAAALAIHPVDDNINHHFAGVGAADTFFKPGKYIGETATLAGASLAIYATGRLRDTPKVSHIGMDLIRALVVDEAITQTLKFSVRRERPDGSDRHSFPSGHSSATFAVATVLERHINWRMSVPAYLFASYVAMSRLHENKHFASDVAFGAAVGIIAGRTVTQPGSDKYAFAIAPIPGGVGIQFATNFAH
ncbi:MAG: phosphatase PAP2 family protein [Acidobacteriota bacterium]